MTCRRLDPLISHSIALIDPDQWVMGSMMLCKKVVGAIPEDAITTWEDGSSSWYLCPKPPAGTTGLTFPGDLDAGRFYTARKSRAIYNISPNVVCKVCSWVEGMQSEAANVLFVQKNAPTIPVPSVIHYWIDHSWHRSFFLMRRAPGEKLLDVWPRLSKSEIKQIATEVASYAKILAQFTSQRVETLDGYGINENWLLGGWDQPRLEWQPITHPPYTRDTLMPYLIERYLGETPPDPGDKFFFYHDDMQPGNIIVTAPSSPTESWRISAIIDWETAGFYPYWWLTTKPSTCPVFCMQTEQGENDFAWMDFFGQALEQVLGFPKDMAWITRFAHKNNALVAKDRGDSELPKKYLRESEHGRDSC